MMPGTGSADDRGLRTERGETNLRALEWNQPAIAPDLLADPVDEERQAAHHAAAKNDRVRTKDDHQVRQAQAEVMRFAIHSRSGQLMPGDRHFTDSLRAQVQAGATGGSERVHPFGHGRSPRQNLPTAGRAAVASRPAGIDNLVADLGVKVIDASIKLAVEDDSDSNAGPHRHVEQARFAAAGAPESLAQRRCIGIVFECHANSESRLERCDEVGALPGLQEFHFADLTAPRVDRPGAPDTDSINRGGRALGAASQHSLDAIDPRFKPAGLIRRTFVRRQHVTGLVHKAHSDFRAANIDGSNGSGFPRFHIDTGTGRASPPYPLRRPVRNRKLEGPRLRFHKTADPDYGMISSIG